MNEVLRYLDKAGLAKLIELLRTYSYNLFNSFKELFINADEVTDVSTSDDIKILVTLDDEVRRITYQNMVKQYHISAIPARNQIVYTTLDSNIINVEHTELESNVYHVDKGFGILTFKSNNFESISFGPSDTLYSCRLPEGMKSLGGKGFQNCTALQEVYLPNSITKFTGNDTFDNCQSLRHLTLPNKLESTGGYTFRNCQSLEEIYLPDTLNNMVMLSNLSSLRFVKLPSNPNFTTVSQMNNCTALEKVYLPSNITAIGSSAFSGCTNLRDLNLDKIKTIGGGAFNNCTSMREITIPATQEMLGQDIVSRTHTDKLVIKATKPQFHQFSFSGTTTKFLDYYGEYLPSECTLPLSEAETVILRSTKEVLKTQEGEYNLDDQIKNVYSWLKIYVPNNLLDGYKEYYPRLANNFYPMYSN